MDLWALLRGRSEEVEGIYPQVPIGLRVLYIWKNVKMLRGELTTMLYPGTVALHAKRGKVRVELFRKNKEGNCYVKECPEDGFIVLNENLLTKLDQFFTPEGKPHFTETDGITEPSYRILLNEHPGIGAEYPFLSGKCDFSILEEPATIPPIGETWPFPTFEERSAQPTASVLGPDVASVPLPGLLDVTSFNRFRASQLITLKKANDSQNGGGQYYEVLVFDSSGATEASKQRKQMIAVPQFLREQFGNHSCDVFLNIKLQGLGQMQLHSRQTGKKNSSPYLQMWELTNFLDALAQLGDDIRHIHVYAINVGEWTQTVSASDRAAKAIQLKNCLAYREALARLLKNGLRFAFSENFNFKRQLWLPAIGLCDAPHVEWAQTTLQEVMLKRPAIAIGAVANTSGDLLTQLGEYAISNGKVRGFIS